MNYYAEILSHIVDFDGYKLPEKFNDAPILFGKAAEERTNAQLIEMICDEVDEVAKRYIKSLSNLDGADALDIISAYDLIKSTLEKAQRQSEEPFMLSLLKRAYENDKASELVGAIV